MPEWIHNRAEHIQAKNPSMPKSEAFAIATQQAHAVGKSPKGYGTSEGRERAKQKYRTPGDDSKTAAILGPDFFAKIAALTPEEAAAFEAAVRRHAEFEQMASKGNMPADQTAQMRHNVERLKAFRQKKKDDSFTIPDWMHKPDGAPPSEAPRGSPPPRGGSSYSGSRPGASRGWPGDDPFGGRDPFGRRERGSDPFGGRARGSDPSSSGRPPGGSDPFGGRRDPFGSDPFDYDSWRKKHDERWEAHRQKWEEENRKWHEDFRRRAEAEDRAYEASRRAEEARAEYEAASAPKPPSNTLHQAAILGGLGYLGLADQKRDPDAPPDSTRSRIGSHLATTVPLGLLGHNLGTAFSELGLKSAPYVGGAIGAGVGALLGEHVHNTAIPREADLRAGKASRTESGEKKLRREAGRSAASHGRGHLLTSAINFAPMAIFGGPGSSHQAGTATLASTVGKGLIDEQTNAQAMEKLKSQREKNAFSTNSFSGPMNPNIQSGASVIPPFKVPGLKSPVEKRAEEEEGRDNNRLPRALLGSVAGAAIGGNLGTLGGILASRLGVNEDLAVNGGTALGALGGAYLGGRYGYRDRSKKPEHTKAAASAPTRGNFMMASDVPPMRVPSLRAPIEKDSEMLDYYPYGPGDFKPAKLTGKVAAAFSNPIFQQAARAKTVGLPKVTAPPGPSIADVAKPKGPGFGSGIAGAFKSTIGGSAGVSEK